MKLPPQPQEQENADAGGDFCEIHASRTRTAFFAMFVAGLFFTFGTLQFEPRGLLLLFIPVFVTAFAWLYLKATERGFVLLQRTLPTAGLENETISVELELCYKAPFAMAWVSTFPAVDVMSSPRCFSATAISAAPARQQYTSPLNPALAILIGARNYRAGYLRLSKPADAPLKPSQVWLNPPATKTSIW